MFSSVRPANVLPNHEISSVILLICVHNTSAHRPRLRGAEFFVFKPAGGRRRGPIGNKSQPRSFDPRHRVVRRWPPARPPRAAPRPAAHFWQIDVLRFNQLANRERFTRHWPVKWPAAAFAFSAALSGYGRPLIFLVFRIRSEKNRHPQMPLLCSFI